MKNIPLSYRDIWENSIYGVDLLEEGRLPIIIDKKLLQKAIDLVNKENKSLNLTQLINKITEKYNELAKQHNKNKEVKNKLNDSIKPQTMYVKLKQLGKLNDLSVQLGKRGRAAIDIDMKLLSDIILNSNNSYQHFRSFDAAIKAITDEYNDIKGTSVSPMVIKLRVKSNPKLLKVLPKEREKKRKTFNSEEEKLQDRLKKINAVDDEEKERMKFIKTMIRDEHGNYREPTYKSWYKSVYGYGKKD